MARYIIVDLESTGLHRTEDRIVSVAAIDLHLDEEFYEEVNPLRPVSKGAAKVHGLTDAALACKPVWSVVGPRFWRWLLLRQRLGGALCLVGHNAKAFDVPMLAAELARLQALPPALGPIYIVDTLPICREVFPKSILASKTQASVYEHLFQSEPDGQHNALGDVRALARIAREPVIRRRLEIPELAFKFELGAPGGVAWPASLVWPGATPRAPQQPLPSLPVTTRA